MKDTENIIFLDAVPEDAEGIRFVQKETWLATYPNPSLGISRADIEEKINEMQGDSGLERLQKRILEQHDSHTWVAKNSNQVIGFIGVQKTEADNKIRALYVLPEYQGKGIGRKLIQLGLDWLDETKQTSLEVVSYNTKAINFYKPLGFIESGETTNNAGHLPSGKELPEILMIRK